MHMCNQCVANPIMENNGCNVYRVREHSKFHKMDKLEIVYLNIRSVTLDKVETFQRVLNEKHKVPHVIIVAGTWLKPNTKYKIKFRNYVQC